MLKRTGNRQSGYDSPYLVRGCQRSGPSFGPVLQRRLRALYDDWQRLSSSEAFSGAQRSAASMEGGVLHLL